MPALSLCLLESILGLAYALLSFSDGEAGVSALPQGGKYVSERQTFLQSLLVSPGSNWQWILINRPLYREAGSHSAGERLCVCLLSLHALLSAQIGDVLGAASAGSEDSQYLTKLCGILVYGSCKGLVLGDLVVVNRPWIKSIALFLRDMQFMRQ